ncbi:MAG: hypothetical protein H8D39_01295, partial [Candidatus Atribacteria bacterium]|nr:hypothetical protein [Candidatus Atribacteria bacterium]
MRDSFVKTIYEVGKENNKVFLLVGDIGDYLLRDFRRDFPERFLNLGIAEANMMGVAAGLAMSGKIPFIYTITPFATARCYDQIRVDVCYQNSNVKIIGVGSGISYSIAGSTHHSLEDIAIMRALPNMIVISPADPLETQEAIRAVVKHKGPVYVRLTLATEPLNYEKVNQYEIGKARLMRDGSDVGIIAAGELVGQALKAASQLESEGVSCRVINMHTIKPIDKEAIKKAVEENKAIITIEEHSIIGGLGSGVAEVIAEEKGSKVLF